MYVGLPSAPVLIVVVLLSAMPSLSFAKIGVICTLDSEYNAVRRMMKSPLTSKLAGRDFTVGTIGRQRVVVVVSPMGKVNNAVTATLLVEHHNIDRILSVGTAGTLTAALPAGSVMYATQAVYHDQGRELSTGFVPYQRRFPVVKLKKLTVERQEFFWGLIASGDQFIANDILAKRIRMMTGGHAVDTNSAAIGTVCEIFNIKCAFLRHVTDGANADSVFRYQMAIYGQLNHLALVKYFLRGGHNEK